MPPQFVGILTHYVVADIRRGEFPRISGAASLLDDPAVRGYYPDGSLYYEDNVAQMTAFNGFLDRVNDFFREKEPPDPSKAYRRPSHLLASMGFNPLPMFGDREYTITYPGWYAQLLGAYDEGGFRFAPIIPCELDRMRIMVSFYRKLTKTLAEELGAALRQWFAEVGSKGVFGENGISSISPVMHYRGRLVTFEVDAHCSGEHTLNTLFLAILDWAMARQQPLEFVDPVAGRKPLCEWDSDPANYARVSSNKLTVPLVVPCPSVPPEKSIRGKEGDK